MSQWLDDGYIHFCQHSLCKNIWNFGLYFSCSVLQNGNVSVYILAHLNGKMTTAPGLELSLNFVLGCMQLPVLKKATVDAEACF